MARLIHYLEDIPSRSVLHSFSALDFYHGMPDTKILHVYTEADLIELAKVYNGIEYPGHDKVDAIVNCPEGRIYFRCIENTAKPPQMPFSVMNFYYDPAAMKYLDPYCVYDDVRNLVIRYSPILNRAELEKSWQIVVDLAILISRYRFSDDDITTNSTGNSAVQQKTKKVIVETLAEALRVQSTPPAPLAPAFIQKDLITEIFAGSYSKTGLQFLKQTGFIKTHWPEFVPMYDVSHSKEHHPEGNVWQHTIETFVHRKALNLALSLGLLFHDSGKPFAHQYDGRKFDQHSQIGARLASEFLRRLGFEYSLIADVVFLAREHMLPAYLEELPTYRTEKVMSSPLFPLLLELYRCDLSSTYRGPDGYYRACKVYRAFLKNVKNPFRTAAGKKIVNMYVE